MNAQSKIDTVNAWFAESYAKDHDDWELRIGGATTNTWTASRGAVVILENTTGTILYSTGIVQTIPVSRGVILMHGDLARYLSVRQMKAILLHEIGHLLFGMSELKADKYAVDCGYGYSLAAGLEKLYKLLWVTEWEYQPTYFGTPLTRVARIRKNARIHRHS